MLKNKWVRMIKSVISFFLVLVLASATRAQDPGNCRKDQLLVKIKQEWHSEFKNYFIHQQFDLPQLDSLCRAQDLKKLSMVGKSRKRTNDIYILQFGKILNINKVIESFYHTGYFEHIEPNFIGVGGGYRMSDNPTPDDANFSRQHNMFNDGSFSLTLSKEDADIDMDLAWKVEQGAETIIVAILDTGVKLDHPEFEGRVWVNEQETDDGEDTDNNGYKGDIHGWDFVNNDNDPSDDSGHGTNVAGILGANGNNGIGYAGVDWNCKLMACKIVDSENFGEYVGWIDAIYYAVDHGADVINMSVGGISNSSFLKEAIDYAYDNGVVVVASMMNNNLDRLYYPAAYENTIAVGATDPNDVRSSSFLNDDTKGSNYGSHIDVVAPGNYIYGLDYMSNTNYETFWGGTSQAAPLVSGLSSLLLAQDPSRSPDEIRQLIRDYAQDQVGDPSEDIKGFDMYYGYGRINAHHSLNPNIVGLEEGIIPVPDFLIYPNPATDYIMVELRGTGQLIRLVNGFGKVMIEKTSPDNNPKLRIDLGGFSRGIYIVQVVDKRDQKVQSKKFVLR